MRLPIALLVLSAVLGGAPPTAAAGLHAHAPAPAPAATARSAAAQRFATDATLRREMQGIRASVEGLGHYEHGHLGAPQAAVLAAAIEGHVRTIIATCKLPPDADAALHGIIVPLLQNAGALRKNPKDLAAIAPMREALARYDRQFRKP